MAEVLSPPATATSPSPRTTPTPRPESPREPRPQARERIPSYAQNRMSQYSTRTSRSRPRSSITTYPAFASSLPYTLVRDFAYEVFHPLHYGAPPDPPSGATTPGSDWNPGGRRLSDPSDGGAQLSTGGNWSAGPWGGDGSLYADPDGGMESLPSTSFGDENVDLGAKGEARKQHRKSKSYADMSDYERGRRRESRGTPRGGAGGGDDMFLFSGQQSDPAGRDSLRQSRGYGYGSNNSNSNSTTTPLGQRRRDSHFQRQLSNTNSQPQNENQNHQQQQNTCSDLPLDSEIPLSASFTSPQRQSIGPDDEELYAGQSLALYTFEPENANELRLTEGQVIMVSYRHGQGWLVAEDPGTGEQGLVPEAYVRLLSDLPHFDPVEGVFREVEGEVDGDGEEEGPDEEEAEREDDSR